MFIKFIGYSIVEFIQIKYCTKKIKLMSLRDSYIRRTYFFRDHVIVNVIVQFSQKKINKNKIKIERGEKSTKRKIEEK